MCVHCVVFSGKTLTASCKHISRGFEEFLVFLFVGIHVVGLTSVPINHPLASLSALHPQLTTLQQLSFTFTFTFTLKKKIFSFTFALNAPSHSTTVQFRLICLHPTSFQQLPLFSFSGPDNFGR